MIVHVAGLWELGWNTPIKELDLWEHPLRDFGVDEFHMSPVTGIRSRVVQEHHNLGELIEDLRVQGLVPIFFDELAETPLQEFEHPENAVYVFGKASVSAMAAYAKPGDLTVRIEYSEGRLWPHQAMVLALYDRKRKGM